MKRPEGFPSGRFSFQALYRHMPATGMGKSTSGERYFPELPLLHESSTMKPPENTRRRRPEQHRQGYRAAQQGRRDIGGMTSEEREDMKAKL
ncbi:MAG TPA: hypothetical protein VF798_01290, partial [Burkholderiaceae bacterium]